MLKLNVLLLIVTALFISACESHDHERPVNPSFCVNVFKDTGTSRKVFEQTLYMWEEAFHQLYEFQPDSIALPIFPLVVPADSLNQYLNPQPVCPDSCYSGFKAYLAQVGPASTKLEVAENLCLILVPYTYVHGDMTDTVFPNSNGPFIKIHRADSITEITYINKGAAQNMIDAWSAQYSTVADSIMVPITSFVIPITTLQHQIQQAQAQGYDGNVYLTFGCHSIPPNNTEYCIRNAQAYQNNTDVYGYLALNLMLSTRKPTGSLEHSEDFLRPCPRYCGNAMFTANF